MPSRRCVPKNRQVTWVLDLDGVVWLADEVIPGVPEAIDRLRAAGRQVLFLSNNSGPRIDAYLAKLAGMGIAATTRPPASKYHTCLWPRMTG